MYVQVHTVNVTTDASGDATVFSAGINGVLDRIVYEKDDFSDGVDFTITIEDTAETLWAEENVNASASRAPRQATHSTAGVAALYAATGTAVLDRIAVNGRVKIVVAAGGATTSGTFHIVTI